MNNKDYPPIAIVGIGCRFPGSGTSPEKFWKMLISKTDAIGDVPFDRWDQRKYYSEVDGKPGKIRHKQGGFLSENLMEFDPLFFNMSPREGETLDPQQRMLLEISTEAFEDAGMTVESLKGSKTGVFVGGFMPENLLAQATDKYQINSHTVAGSTMTMLSNRISYIFDLKGPSLSLDTACSSSLVATHYACQSIWNGESTMALAGGANFLISPESSIFISKAKFLSNHSRCKAFDSDAQGYVRGEGAGIVVLKPLADALRDHDKIYATIIGTGVNQDGGTNGITVPNGEAQLNLIRETYAKYNIDKEKINYVEAHGTGTQVGDPIEFRALNEALSGTKNRKAKCLVGSVKTNIGHLEAASGVAGLIKTVLSLHHNAVPPNLHFNNPNPALDYENSNLRVPTSMETLPESYDSLASVNSFGFGGTNAHVVLKQFQAPKENSNKARLKNSHFIFPVCAKSDSALKDMAARLRKLAEENSENFEEILSNVIYRRSRWAQRLAVVATSKEEVIEKLEAYENDILLKGVNHSTASENRPKLVFVYTGMGPQWWKMGRELMETEPVFREVIEACDQDFKAVAGWSVYEELNQPMESSKILQTNIAQPANIVIQLALTKLLEHYGIVPDAVVGHSVGEVSSACISGALSIQEAMAIGFHRSRLQHQTSGMGSMLAVGLSEADALERIKPYTGISVAAVNSPKAVTLSGDTGSLKEVQAQLESEGLFCRLMDVTVPYHSPVMDVIKEELLTTLAHISGGDTKTDLYSTVTGGKIAGTEITNEYWWKNVREPVHFATTFNTLVADGYDTFIEIGPHPVLKNSMQECAAAGKQFYFLQTLNRKEGEQLSFYDGVAKLFTLGYPIKWERFIERSAYTQLPVYPWQRIYLWRNPQRPGKDELAKNESLFAEMKVAGPATAYEFELNGFYFPFLNDHIVHGKVIFPGAGYVCLATAIYQLEVNRKTPVKLEAVTFSRVLPVFEKEIQKLHLAFDTTSGQYSYHYKNGMQNDSWTEVSTGRFSIGNFEETPAVFGLTEVYSRLQTTLTEESIYERLSRSRLDYGPYFRCIKEIKAGDRELIAKIELNPALVTDAGNYLIHPTLLDACFQTTIILYDGDCVPVSIGKIDCYAQPGQEILCYANLKYADENTMIASLVLCNSKGDIIMRIENLKCRQLVNDSAGTSDSLKNNLFQAKWLEKETAAPGTLVEEHPSYVFTNNTGYGGLLPTLLKNVVTIECGDEYKEIGEHHYQASLFSKTDIARLWPKQFEVLNIIIVFPLYSPDRSLPFSEQCLQQVLPVLNMAQTLAEKGQINMTIITQGSQVVTGEEALSTLEYSALHGLGRSLVNELPDCQVRLIDLDHDDPDTWNSVAALINTTGEVYEELALRNGRVFQKKLVEWKPGEQPLLEQAVFQSEALKLNIPAVPGQKDFYFERSSRPAPGPDEIEILIDNTTVNDAGYLKLCNRIPDNLSEDNIFEKSLGNACAGTVERTGSNVSEFQEGDKVLAIAPGTMQTFTNTPALLAVKCPPGLTVAASANIMNYVTAVYCLGDKASLQKNSKVFIHNAAQEIGLAAVYYAHYLGAEIFATVESEQQKTFLNSIGVAHVFISGRLDFPEQIRKITSEKGVDVLLSSLSGEILYQSFSCLADYGVYIDLNRKSGFFDLPAYRRNFSYIAVDINRMLVEKQETIAELLREVAGYIEAGNLPPLPAKVYPASQVSAVIQHFEENETPGTAVIDFSNQTVEIINTAAGSVKTNGTYLVTGGTKGLGLEVAKWLAGRGVKNLALVSRSGLNDEAAKAAVAAMEDSGVTVRVYAADVSQPDEVQELFNKMKQELPPLAGIFHGAMVLDDGYLADMTEQRFRTVLKPKIDGAMNLHHQVADMNLDTFVVFSSISSLIGNLGQANYVVANAFLDSFAIWRNSMGLPATAINLGSLAESGVVARSENLVKILESSGINSLSNKQVLEGLELILKEKPVQVGFFDLNWPLFFKNGGKTVQALFSELNGTGSDSIKEQLSTEQVANRNNLLGLKSESQQEFVTTHLQKHLGKILKISPEHISLEKGINLLGVDSILTVELMNAIWSSFAINIPPIEFLTGPSLKQLSGKILDNFSQTASA